jgi:hypothetical protein
MHRRCRCIYIRPLFGRSDPQSRLSETTPRVPHSPTFVLTRSPLQKNPLCAERRQQAPDPNPILCFPPAPAALVADETRPIQSGSRRPVKGEVLDISASTRRPRPHPRHRAYHKSAWIQGILIVGELRERAARGEIEGAATATANGPVDGRVPVLSKRTGRARAGGEGTDRQARPADRPSQAREQGTQGPQRCNRRGDHDQGETGRRRRGTSALGPAFFAELARLEARPLPRERGSTTGAKVRIPPHSEDRANPCRRHR